MIVYTTTGTNDLRRAAAFYDALFAPLGYKRLIESDSKFAWGTDTSRPMFFASKPFDERPASAGVDRNFKSPEPGIGWHRGWHLP